MSYPVPDSALARHIAVVGETGSGKTHNTKTVVEHVAGEGYRVCVLDTIKSDWWGITSSASGKKPGLPFKILGGPRGHIPLHSGAGKAIGQLVGEGKLPLSIIDMADFEPGGPQKFFEHFAQSLWKHIRGVVYLVIEEAHELAPKERAGFNAENMAIHWAKKLATGSRTKGIRLIIASQRTQAVHNALLGSCGTLMAHSLSLPADQKPIIDWLKANVRDTVLRDTIEEDLAFLPTGTAWVCCAKDNFFDKIKFPKIATFDNTATPDKDADDFDVATAPVNPDELKAIIGDAVKEAEANDPKALKAEIAKLKGELQKAQQASGMPDHKAVAKINEAAQQGYDKGYGEGWRDASKQVGDRAFRARANVSKAIELLTAADTVELNGIVIPPPPPEFVAAAQRPIASQKPVNRIIQPPKRPVQVIQQRQGNGHLPPGERAVLTAAAQFGGVEREQLTVLTGYKRSSRDAYIQRLREKGYVDLQGSAIIPTDSGLLAIPDFEPLPTGRDLQAYWLNRLPEGERRILQILLDEYPHSVARSALDEATGYARSSRDAYLQRMKAKRLWDPDGNSVRASEVLFE